MIVLGADTHKRSHTIAAVAAGTGEVLGEKTVPVGARGFASLLVWARGLEGERVWALEDCRHVAGSFERFLIARGERVLRVPTKLMADARRAARERGKSDSIDAMAVARAALREGLGELPVAKLDGPELDLRLLVDHRERLVGQRVGLNNTLQWHLHDLWPELTLPGGALFSAKWSIRIGRRLAPTEQTMRVRIARDELRRLRELTQTIKALEGDRPACRSRRATAAHPARLRAADRGQTRRRDRGRRTLCQRRQARPRRRPGTDPRQFGQDQPPLARPGRQPPDQRRDPSNRCHPRPLPPGDPRLHRPQACRRQEHQSSHPLPQAPPRATRLAPAPAAQPPTATATPINFLT
jgi:transposase